MVAAPYLLLGLFGFLAYKGLKKSQNSAGVPTDGQDPTNASSLV
jgi:hypothetical protein